MRIVRSHLPLVLMLLALSRGLGAQSRVIDLSGPPVGGYGEGFTSISGFAPLGRTHAVLVDASEPRLTLLDLRTSRLAEIGRRGGGPGEWQQPTAVHRSPQAGLVLVGDPQRAGFHEIDSTGRIVRTIPVPSNEIGKALAATTAKVSDSRGRLYFTAPLGMAGPPSDSVAIQWLEPLTGATGALGKLTWSGRVTMTRRGTMTTTTAAGGILRPVDAYIGLPDNRLAIVRGAPYRLEVLAAGGHVSTGPTLPYVPVRVGTAEREAYRAARARIRPVMMSSGGSGTFTQRNQTPTADEEFPDVLPPFETSTAALLGPNSEIWVHRAGAASSSRTTYDILNLQGQKVAEARLRPHSRILAFESGRVFVARLDPADDLEYLEWYAMR